MLRPLTSFGDESRDLLVQNNNPSDSQASRWVKRAIFLLSDHGFFDGWDQAGRGVDEVLSGEDRDRLIGEICRRQNKPIISRDEKQKQKNWRDLTCFTPEQWAEKSNLTKDAAARMCADRLHTAGLKYLAKHRAEGTYTDRLAQNVVQFLNEFNARWAFMPK